MGIELSYQAILFIIGGLVAGLVLGWFASYVKSKFVILGLNKEIREYKEHLHRQMKITSEGSKNLEQEVEKVKKENENLRISVQTLSQKPGSSEIRLLNIYDSALRKMQMKAPGFSPAWEISLQEAEQDYEANEKGFKSIIKKVFSPSIVPIPDADIKEIGDLPKGFEHR